MPVLVLDEFLVASEIDELWRTALERRDDFVRSRVLSGRRREREDGAVRRSRILFDVERQRQLFSQRIARFLPLILRRLDEAWFDIGHVEAQLTASNDGEFFRRHTDNGDERVAGRALTFVYFFHRDPRPFDGGELRVYEGEAETVVPARANQIAFFPSGLTHEVSPVECPTRDFADSRFTLNGWLHRA
jgi:Rps23 Pro-64 3,4-dihydroxylase Tpa1-like proline 4-hydroxylase